MVTLNAAFLQKQFNNSTMSDEEAEVVLDGGINMLNAFDAGLNNLAGAPATKSGTYTSKETGAIMAMAQQIYQKHFKNAAGANVAVSSLSLSYSSDSQLLTFAKELAAQLKGKRFEKV